MTPPTDSKLLYAAVVMFCIGAAVQVVAEQSSRPPLDRCALLTDADVQRAIGPHGTGSTTVENEWGLQSCRWKATVAPKGSAPAGWFDMIEIAVFEPNRTSWAREQAKGEPVTGFVRDAKYDESYGELWFSCATDRVCVVKARTASGQNRAQIARDLAAVVERRLR